MHPKNKTKPVSGHARGRHLKIHLVKPKDITTTYRTTFYMDREIDYAQVTIGKRFSGRGLNYWFLF